MTSRTDRCRACQVAAEFDRIWLSRWVNAGDVGRGNARMALRAALAKWRELRDRGMAK